MKISILPPETRRLLHTSNFTIDFIFTNRDLSAKSILLDVVEKTNNDPTAVSFIYVAKYAPLVILAFIGGTFADRWQPK